MIQQLSLFGSLSDADAPIMRKTLSVMTGMPPRPTTAKVLVWEPEYLYRPTLAAGEVNQIEQYRLFMVSKGSTNLPSYPSDDNDNSERAQEARRLYLRESWCWHILEVPEPGRGLRVISQQMYSAEVGEGNPFAMLKALGYKFVRQYYTLGVEYVLKNVVFWMYRVHKQGEITADNSHSGSSETANDSRPASPPEEKDDEPLLFDKSGQWACKAWVRVGSVSDLPAIEVATAELLTFQQDLKGLVALEVPARSCFDTRMRSF